MKAFITGGAGFIGSNLAHRLIGQGHDVVVYDDLSRRGTDKNVAWLRAEHGDRWTLIQADIRDFETLRRALDGAEVVYHLASQVAVTTSVLDPRHDFEVNALGTFNVLEAARLAARPPIVLYASTNKVYGGMEDVAVVPTATGYAYRDFPLGIPETQPLDFHSPYGCCYSADTDVLTGQGWKRFYELTPADVVLTYNLARRVAEFQAPTAHFAYPYTGKMYVQKNRRFRTCVTPNHRMLVSWECNHDELEHPRFMEARHIEGKPMAYLLAAEVADGEECQYFNLPEVVGAKHKHDFPARPIPMDDWLRFLGWYLAEGHCHESRKTGNCTVTLSTYYRTDEAVAVMKAIGLSPVVDHHHIIATSKQLYAYLKPLGKSHDKYIPAEFKQLHPKHLRVLLHALLDGDGSKAGKNGWRYTTVSPRLADDVQEIAIRCGLAASVVLDKEGFYRLNIGSTRTSQCNLDGNRSEWIDYEGMTYCVEVPNSAVLVRQNGRPYFSGNSKGAGDQYVRDYQRIFQIPTVVFRQSCIMGPRQFGVEDQGWVAWFLIAAVTGRPITIYGDGRQVRDVLWVDDLLDAYQAAIDRIDVAAGQIYNVGGGPDNVLAVWSELGPMLEALVGHRVEVGWADWRPGDQRIFVADVGKAARELGWRPTVGKQEGVRRLYEWVAANRALFD